MWKNEIVSFWRFGWLVILCRHWGTRFVLFMQELNHWFWGEPKNVDKIVDNLKIALDNNRFCSLCCCICCCGFWSLFGIFTDPVFCVCDVLDWAGFRFGVRFFSVCAVGLSGTRPLLEMTFLYLLNTGEVDLEGISFLCESDLLLRVFVVFSDHIGEGNT